MPATGSWKSSPSKPSPRSRSSSLRHMRIPDIRRVACIVAILCAGVAIAAQDGNLKERLTPGEVDAVRAEVADAGTSGVPAVITRVLLGDPRRPGLYTIELRIAQDTTIQARTRPATRGPQSCWT